MVKFGILGAGRIAHTLPRPSQSLQGNYKQSPQGDLSRAHVFKPRMLFSAAIRTMPI